MVEVDQGIVPLHIVEPLQQAARATELLPHRVVPRPHFRREHAVMVGEIHRQNIELLFDRAQRVVPLLGRTAAEKFHALAYYVLLFDEKQIEVAGCHQ